MTAILVTGASGTVGSVVAAALGARGMVRTAPAPGQVAGDLTDPGSLARALDGVDTVVHCAAALSDDWGESERGNIDGTRNLLAAMRAARCRLLVHVSTVSVYDYRAGRPLDEDCPMWTERLEPYAFTKAEAERLVAAGDIPYVILRPVVVLSLHPRSHWGARALERARTATAPLWPLTRLPHVHVDNFATACGLALRTPAAIGRAYNVMDATADARVFNAHLFAAVGRELPASAAPPFELAIAADRIRAELGYAPPDRFAEFLAALHA